MDVETSPKINGYHTPQTAPENIINHDEILQYLTSLLRLTLGATQHDLESERSLLSHERKAETVERCNTFLQSNRIALYAAKRAIAEQENGDTAAEGKFKQATQSPSMSDERALAAEPLQHFYYFLSGEFPVLAGTVASVAILKRPQPINLALPLQSQLQIVNLPGISDTSSESQNANQTTLPFEHLHSVVHSALSPYFDAFSRSREEIGSNTRVRAEHDQRTGVPSAKKKLAEFELSLLQLQQNAEIPQLSLPLHPAIRAALDSAGEHHDALSTDLIPRNLLNDSSFLNHLQNMVNGWTRSIQAVTRTNRNVSSGTASQEIKFWLDLEAALADVESQVSSEGVKLTLEVLNNAKRFAPTKSFNTDTGLKEATEQVQNNNKLMRDFPIDELLAAPSLEKVRDAVDIIFSHLNRKLRICPYPVKRALGLVEAVSMDLDARINALMSGRALMRMSYRDFEKTMIMTTTIWQTWDDNVKEFTNVARELTRRRNERYIPIKFNMAHTQTKDRLRYVTTFRTSHEQLHLTIQNVLSPQGLHLGEDDSKAGFFEEMGDVDAIKEVSEAYAALRDVDVMDVSEEGTMVWDRAETAYNERTARVENSIIARLRDRLATAKNANEMFRVFSKFNALFVRPKIRGAISEYQTQLINNVKADISALHERFKQQYGHSQAHSMAQLHDVPPVSGSIMWARQIERQLDGYMKRVENVLGSQWHIHSEGQRLQSESADFRKKLDVMPVYQSWMQDVTKRNITISGRLFSISRTRASGNALELSVNFDSQIITLFKETRNLLWLKFTIPHAINNISKDARRVYPYAVSLIESVRTLAQVVSSIDGISKSAVLLHGYRDSVHKLVAKGLPLKWESFVHAYDLHIRPVSPLQGVDGARSESLHVQFVRDFSQSVSVLQAKTSTLLVINELVQKSISNLKDCQYRANLLQEEINAIQAAVDRLSLEGFSNLSQWVEKTNDLISDILLERLEQALRTWMDTFQNPDHSRTGQDAAHRTGVSGAESPVLPKFDTLIHEVSMQNSLIYLDPPLDFARSSWLVQLNEWIGVICDLPLLQASRYELNVREKSFDRRTTSFSRLLSHCTGKLSSAYVLIEGQLSVVSEYVNKWLQFQSLWDLQSDQVYEALGDDLHQWLKILSEIRQSRSVFDTSEPKRQFGHLVIDYEQVQVKINAKYDLWQNDVLSKFASKLGGRMNEVFSELERCRQELEHSSLETSSTAQAVSFITSVQNAKRRVHAWQPEIENFRQGQTALTRQRFQLPSDWLYMERIDGEWLALNEILERKSRVVQDQTDALRAKVSAEDKVIVQRITDITSQWNEERPISGTIVAEQALSVLADFRSRVSKLNNDYEMVSKAKEALDIPPTSDPGLSSLLEEVQDLEAVWGGLATIYSGLNDLRDMPWSGVQPRKLRQSLENLMNMSKEMPARMRQYAPFEHLQNRIRQLQKTSGLLGELRSDAVRERHWNKIYKALKPSKRYSQVSMTLGDVWDLQLAQNEAYIRDVLVQAQGEMALEEFLKQVRETWSNYSLDLVNYQNKCRLIRGWDELFTKCSENLNSLQAMRHSPYYKEFEEDASAWEDKLNRVFVIFDVWIDVQRQWIYLEGVFTGNADIKHLLPTESSRFQNINSEFFAVMKKVQRSPFVMEVLAISGVQKSLERLADLLQKIQKALGEYLERERVSFPRFYFVGDEDLLEIIGNGNDTVRVGRHLAKMFAGISGLVTSEDSSIIAFRSKEGEEVQLRERVSLAKTPKVNEWLAALESGMRNTLSENLAEAVTEFERVMATETGAESINSYLSRFPAQVAVLGGQVWWTNAVDTALRNGGQNLRELHTQHVSFLEQLADLVIGDLDVLSRKKCEHLITEFVFQRDAIEELMHHNVNSPDHYLWLLRLRYVFNPVESPMYPLQIHMANAVLPYGFEYLGVPERLVRTPLTERCFLTMTQALSQKLGGSPYGPAGTGKTETVKALGLQLGRFTLVFCCDDTFDFQAMGRIFLGICQVGAWGCFDEFNRLEERILSAVSQQVQNIQLGLKESSDTQSAGIELIGRQLKLNSRTGIFITMNPGYAGRSNLPDNLKKLFRSVAMSKPDKELIAEVTLYSQGFNTAKNISRQIVPFFEHCHSRMTNQAHYDFGLRALKSVLISSGGLKRSQRTSQLDEPEDVSVSEPKIVVQSLRETIGPKLIKQDVEVMQEIEELVFPGVPYVPAPLDNLRAALKKVGEERHLVVNEAWMTKAVQLYQIQHLHHGLMMVGSSGAGKSATWSALLSALQEIEGVEGVSYVIDPKVMSKEALYGSLDPTTREWSDGLFTGILRKIIDNLRGEGSRRHWIIFDGDVDPEWVENLNSVLDDNKLLTLPNGERLVLPPNVRILFEVETLRYATLATVSRCGMVWFNEENVSTDMMFSHYLSNLKTAPFEEIDDDSASTSQSSSKMLDTQAQVARLFQNQLQDNRMLHEALSAANSKEGHIMTFTNTRALGTLFSLLNQVCKALLRYNAGHTDFPLQDDQVEAYVSKRILIALVWSFAGDCPLDTRHAFSAQIASLTNVDLPDLSGHASLIDFQVTLPESTWVSWQTHVPSVEVNTHSITQTDAVIPTIDTVRHEDVLYSWLEEHKPLILCGPPGAGKTMTLFSALRKLPDMEVVGLNFSSATTPDLIMKSFEQHCEYRKTLNGTVLSPTQIGRWLVIFCDEVNLPATDKYGTQRVIAFMRQLIESHGFWRTSDRAWVSLERIQFVGACNPPTDAGRVPLGLRFLRHAPLVMVDYPGQLSLSQIYGTFNSAVMKILPALRGYSQPLTEAMVQLYAESQARFTTKIQPHYIYSPRELTRWVRGIYEAIKPLETLSLEGLVRIWAHEALRLFQDRLVAESERKWTHDAIERIAFDNFPTIDRDKALAGPILFSNWLSRNYIPVDRDELRDFVKARLRTFCEEEIDVPLVLYDDALDHILRIDRVFRQPQGHVILIGVSGSGKTTLSRFVAWMNGLKTYQIKVHGKYSSQDFDDDLRDVLRRCGCKGEKICFIMDESNVLDSAFLERMNTLLANAEVPGLFEGDEYASLITACKEGAQRQGLILDSADELYKWFTQQIVKNLHVVFTMNPPEEGLGGKAATSPALFNRCVLNWFGDWTDQTLYQVGAELTQSLDLDRANYSAPDTLERAYRELSMPPTHRDAVVNAMVYFHNSLHGFNRRLQKQQNRITFLTPRHFLDFVSQYTKLFTEKREDLEEQQRHLNVGLEKLKDTVEKVRDLRQSLAGKKSQLEAKDAEANESLAKMINDQKQAEQRRAASLEIQGALEKQEQEVAERREIVLGDLEKAEPAVLEAQKSVQNIKKQQLTEVRSMSSPPAGVKLALEAVCTLLGHRVDNWKAIQAIVRRDDFIASIVNYDNEKQMTATHRNKMRNDYLRLDDFTFEKVNRASKACGPLVQWVSAQVNYSDILDRVGPLREEVGQLEEAALQTKAEAQAIENNIKELEDSIALYKSEYASLISETQAIKSEMSRVEQKVERSLHLLDSLSSERKRWEQGSKSFEDQIDTIVGDVLVAAAFIAYSGFYDQQYRKLILEDWSHHLSLAGIRFKATNPVAEYLSTADERLQWQENSLPADDLCTENAIILKRFNRYPLIIDPSGRIVEFLQREHKERKLTVTSFLDDNFTKQVESSLRFGNPILIQDAEYMDPILNHVLNKEYQKTGGRVLIQLGKQEIDFSPAFRLYLSTRNPSATFAPDICSRTTFANFTVTQSSLQAQSLNEVLKSERPDVDERRSNLIKMQGEFKIHLRRLERRLLQALNESQGNILDDDKVVETLETVKKEVGDITEKVNQTDGVMAEVDQITSEYKVIAQSCSAIFAVLEQLRHISHFYQFSLQYFIDIFDGVLHTAKTFGDKRDYKGRVSAIIKELFTSTFQRTSATILQKDRMTFALLLAQAAPFDVDRSLFDLLLDEDLPFVDATSMPDVDGPSIIQEAVSHPRLAKRFHGRDHSLLTTLLTNEYAEAHLPELASSEHHSEYDVLLQDACLIKQTRADRLVPAAERLVLAMFGTSLFDRNNDLLELIAQAGSKIPICLCCSPGFDASFKVEAAVTSRQVKCSYIAMGSSEGVSSADKSIAEAAATGSWVFVKNVHLALAWLQGVEKRLDSLKPHSDFRLFLSMETTPKIPVNLLRISRVLMCEQPAGIRANMRDSLSASASRAKQHPVERSRLYLLLSILHSIIQERLRYAPTLGWKASWEFNDADFDCAAYIIDTWTDKVAGSRANVAPTSLPWSMMQALFIITYGGKIDDEGDYTNLKSLVNRLIVVQSFEEKFNVVDAVASGDTVSAARTLELPGGASWNEMEQWVNELPEREPPSYLGLPENAEKLLLVEHGKEMVSNLGRVMQVLDESEQLAEDNLHHRTQGSAT
ncbi:MAG: hypothetical protein Q9162_001421 [Coniocarpon cinnabarinum]